MPLTSHFLCLAMAFPVLKLWPTRPPVGPVAPSRVLSDMQWPPSEDLPVKNCFPRLSGRFPLGALASASTNTDNICEGNKRQFAISAAHAQVIFQPVSPAVEGFECRALDTLPFWKFIYALRGWAVFPSTQFHYI